MDYTNVSGIDRFIGDPYQNQAFLKWKCKEKRGLTQSYGQKILHPQKIGTAQNANKTLDHRNCGQTMDGQFK